MVGFSPDGRRFLSFSDKDYLRIGDVMATPPVPIPAWYCDLVEAVGGKRLTASHDVEPVGKDALQPLRQQFARGQDSDFFALGQMVSVERMKDPAPEFVP